MQAGAVTSATSAVRSTETGRRPFHSEWLALQRPRRRLFAASALMLFLELALIRWTGSNVVHLAYFSNFVLLGSFLGIGVGFLRAGRVRRPPYYSFITLAVLVDLVLAFPVTIDRSGGDVLYFTAVHIEGPPAWLALPVIFVTVAVIMMGPGEVVGRCFGELTRLDAYRFDLLGSLAGIAVFTALSFAGAPPVVWGLLVAVLYALLLVPGTVLTRVVLVVVPAVGLVGLLSMESLASGTMWSPYSKIELVNREVSDHPVITVSANGVPHQDVTDTAFRLRNEPFYGYPYDRTPANPRQDVLVVGAGNGTDTAIALAKGARHVDAVEIDPRLLGLGKYHPDRPYEDPRVETHVDDGRAFLSGTDRKYDLIIFALPDSLTLVPGQGALRLESYLFTEEAFRSARAHLKPGGAFALYNYYRERWLVDRLAGTAAKVFGHAPCFDGASTTGQLAVVTAGLSTADQRCVRAWTPVAATAPTTDDRPFLYLKSAGIPAVHLLVLGLILVVSLALCRTAAGPLRKMRPYLDLLLLGAAFLLLETKSVTGFALLFGTTWVVNAIVFAGVLVAVLAAVEVTQRFRTPPLPVMFGVLFAGLLAAWLVPSSWLLELPVPLRAVTAITIAFLPIFAANVIFAKRFSETADAATAFGANLLGAMIGGCLEYAALATGYHALLVIAAVIYLAAFAMMRRGGRSPALGRPS
jgi:SAM-dependent methyltransferase